MCLLVQEQRHASFALTAEGTTYLELGSPEAQVFAAIPAEGIPQPQLIVSHCSASLLVLASSRYSCCSKGLHETVCCSKSLVTLAALVWDRP